MNRDCRVWKGVAHKGMIGVSPNCLGVLNVSRVKDSSNGVLIYGEAYYTKFPTVVMEMCVRAGESA